MLVQRLFRKGSKASILSGNIVTKILFALAISIAINGIVLSGRGVTAFPTGILPHLPVAIAVLLAIVLAPEAYANGFGRAPQFWKHLHRRLLALLTFALVLRGAGVALAAYLLGFDRNSTLLIATGLTATDPAAIAIALELAGKSGNPIRLQEIFWLYTIESLVNDGIASVAFEIAHDHNVETAVRALGLTLFLGTALAFTDEGVRWYVRAQSRWSHTDREAGAEILAVLLLYIGFAATAAVSHAFPIGTVVLGAILADYLFIHRLPGDRFTEGVEHKRQKFAYLWVEWGFAIFVFVAALFMPYEVLVAHSEHLFNGLVILLIGIVTSRLVYDLLYLVLASKETTVRLSGVSVLLAATLIGIPTFVAVSLYDGGHFKAAYAVFAAIFESWLLVPPALWYIIRLRARMMRAEAVVVTNEVAP